MTKVIAHRLSSLSHRPNRLGFMSFFSLYRQRRALADLDAHLLQDLGLTKHEAMSEAERPVWDAPSNWKA